MHLRCSLHCSGNCKLRRHLKEIISSFLRFRKCWTKSRYRAEPEHWKCNFDSGGLLAEIKAVEKVELRFEKRIYVYRKRGGGGYLKGKDLVSPNKIWMKIAKPQNSLGRRQTDAVKTARKKPNLNRPMLSIMLNIWWGLLELISINF
jgi:hypothetical protein